MNFALLIKISQIENSKSQKCIILNKSKLIIGRKSEIIMDTNKGHEISKNHSKIKLKYSKFRYKWIIYDLKSTNGTFINEIKILKQRLHHLDFIVFGGGDKLCYGEKLINFFESELLYRFIIPDYLINFSKCKDFNNTIILNTDIQCNICFSNSHKLYKLDCNHLFCFKCINKWIKSCIKSYKQIFCPVCRSPINKNLKFKSESYIKNQIEYIRTIEPLLRTLNISNITEVLNLSIKNIWNNDQKDLFWNFLNLIEPFYFIKRTFFNLIDLNYFNILNFSIEELNILLLNLNFNNNFSNKFLLI